MGIPVGIIVAAGYGTRFLPITKTIPKEMLPLGLRPAVDFIVEEFAQSGIERIVFVTSHRKRCLEEYYDCDPELEAHLRDVGNASLARLIEPGHTAGLHFCFVHQPKMRGTGDAILRAIPFAGAGPYVVAYADDIHLSLGGRPLAAQLLDVHGRTGTSVISVQLLPMSEDVSRYGVADIDFTHSYPIARGVVEKPLPGKEPSRYIVVGRYLLNEACVAALQEVESATQTGEVFLTAALNDTAHQGNLAAHILEGERLDIGTPSGYLKSQLRIACG